MTTPTDKNAAAKTTASTAVEKFVDQNGVEYEAMKPFFSTISIACLLPHYQAASVLNQEGERIGKQTKQDMDELINVGMPEKTAEHIQQMPGALRYVESKWTSVKDTQNESEKKWEKLSTEANEILSRLSLDAKFAYGNNPKAITAIRDILKKRSKAAKVQQLASLSMYLREHPAELRRINFDFNLLDRAAELSAELGDLLGEIQVKCKDENSIRVLRMQAYTYLKQLISEVCRYGRYVFHEDREHCREYTMKSLHGRNRKKEDKKTEVVEEVVAGTQAA